MEMDGGHRLKTGGFQAAIAAMEAEMKSKSLGVSASMFPPEHVCVSASRTPKPSSFRMKVLRQCRSFWQLEIVT